MPRQMKKGGVVMIPVQKKSLGGLLGSALGSLGESIFGKTSGIDGSALGRTIGSAVLPFKKGGKAKKRHSKKK